MQAGGLGVPAVLEPDVGLFIDPLVTELVGVQGVRFHNRFREVIELLRTLRDGVNSVGF